MADQKLMLPQKYKFTAEGAEATYLLQKGFSATSATSAVKKAFFATLSKNDGVAKTQRWLRECQRISETLWRSDLGQIWLC
jgi:hypothetical protein